MDFLYSPWPWYVAGPLIGLTVPLLLLLGNKNLGISSTLRQVCAICVPGGLPSLTYNWKLERWNLFFAGGLLIGGFLGGQIFTDSEPVQLSGSTRSFILSLGLNQPQGFLPVELFNWNALFTLRGFIVMIVGGFLVGFGVRYAKGCTSGHGILGLSALQWPSLIATACFFLGGVLFSKFILPFVLAL